MIFFLIVSLAFLVTVSIYALYISKKNKKLMDVNVKLILKSNDIRMENMELSRSYDRLNQAYVDTEALLSESVAQNIYDTTEIMALREDLSYAHKSLEMVLEEHVKLEPGLNLTR